ncbi:MAG: ATP-dependent DNA ligase LigA [Halobacteriales archaeon]|nr:ATP-dependent DNA ligase LigA [Halobacteriales archaeon]
MDFAAFADRAAEIEAETADLEIIALVAETLQSAGEALPIVARFLQGRVFPGWQSITLDIGPNLLYTALARAAGPNVEPADIESRLADTGEIGDVAASYELGGQRGLAAFGDNGEDRSLTVTGVYEELSTLATVEGAGSQDRKLDILFGLFNRCSPPEARYLARLVLSEMRIGVGAGTVRDAIADAFDVDVTRVERALQVSNDYGEVALIARDEGVEGLDAIGLEIGRPIQSMLAQTGTVADALESWDTVATQWKYDGARVQVHYDGSTVSVFSRNMEDVTEALPEVTEFVESMVDTPVILDGEVVAIDADGAPLPFQEVLRRFRRKHDIEEAREDVELRPYFFDCLHVAGTDLLDVSFRDRYDRLTTVLADGSTGTDAAGLSELWLTDNPERIAAIEAEALEAGHEGIMLKNPDSSYSPGRRGQNWLKRKPDVETIDCVVTGAEWGEGRRASLLGTFELSVRADDGYETIGKVATGITDEELESLTELLEPHIKRQDGQTVDLVPAVVFEVGYEEIQTSPTYSSGYALRFPRFLGVREDKDPADADSVERVESLIEDG